MFGYPFGKSVSHVCAPPIDADQRFYLESRGVPPTVAERLIVLGFFDEVLDQLPAPGLIPGLRAQVVAKLDLKSRVEMVRYALRQGWLRAT